MLTRKDSIKIQSFSTTKIYLKMTLYSNVMLKMCLAFYSATRLPFQENYDISL
jgi:hypothetical protein